MYIDTCMLAKLYVPEAESDRVQLAVSHGSPLVSSELLLAEFAAVLRRKVRERALRTADAGTVWEEFQKHVASGVITLIPAGRQQINRATAILHTLSRTIPLRTLDALHLASCLEAVAGPGPLLTNDRVMSDAAIALNIPLQPW